MSLLRWGLLGTARINRLIIPAIRASPRSEVAAVASRTLDRARAYADEWKIPRALGSYEPLMAVYTMAGAGCHLGLSASLPLLGDGRMPQFSKKGQRSPTADRCSHGLCEPCKRREGSGAKLELSE